MSKGFKIFEEFIKNISDRYNLTEEEIALQVGRNKGYISQLRSRNKSNGDEVPEKFMSLLKLHFANYKNSEETQSNEPFHSKLLDKKNGNSKLVPVYGGFTSLGNIEIIDDENVKHRVVAELPANVFPGCDYAEKASGDSMYPLIMNQALLVGKRCTVRGISFGEKYIIKTKDGLDTTKFIHPAEDGKIRLKAYNKSVPDQDVSIEDIIFCCRVKWIINPT